ncbi:MAG: hypothetical protein VX438_09915 [Planctomycetota bacterium]|nr:hypothetical protein [Planctomycetota bacterium]
MKQSTPTNPVALSGSLLILLLACGCGKSGVQGTVTLDNAPVAAGWITFEAIDTEGSTVSGNIHEGQYQIEQKNLKGQYKVKIDVHFAHAAAAAEFYAEINEDPQAFMEQEEAYEFQETLSNGSNVKDFQLQQ